MVRKIVYGLLIALVFALGYGLGNRTKLGNGVQRVTSLLELIQKDYVDEVNIDSISEQALPNILNQLDPHSAYLPANINASESETLGGSFDGIGVQFNRFKDTVIVSRVISGGGSDRAGVEIGDRILKADTTSLLGKEISNDKIMAALKGKSGSVVTLHILRRGKQVTLKVVRGPVPVSSIDAGYMIGDKLYVRINRWGAITYQEFLNLYIQHASKTKGLIIDLRDNSGGYLESAVQLAQEFLPKGKLIVYTQGKNYPREDYQSQRDGSLQDMPLVVLVNEFSASASEIFSGAMQDHDRAMIVGRRTFGKGLVQRPYEFSDGSVVRLTVARYYTPSGRSIQKPYKIGESGSTIYAQDIEERYEHGEMYSADSLVINDTTKYYTHGGRLVYSGGGITPDVFIPRDTVGINPYYVRLVRSGLLAKYAFEYVDNHRDTMQKLNTPEVLDAHLKSLGRKLLIDFAYYAQKEGIGIRSTSLENSSSLLLSQLHALIADNAGLDTGIYYRFINKRSKELIRAVELLDTKSWKPKTQVYAKERSKA